MFEPLLKILSNYSIFIAIFIFSGAVFWLVAIATIKRNYIRALLLAAIALFIIAFGGYIYNWFLKLGTDSFSETANFEIKEAIFLTKNIILGITSVPMRVFFASILMGIFTAIGIEVLRRIIRLSIKTVRMILVIFFILLAGYATYQFSQLFQSNITLFDNLKSNFDSPFKVSKSKADDLQVVVYIGESTSPSNMGIYGYFRKTTPVLSKLKSDNAGFLMFETAFSSHTHTALSLLEALSLQAEKLDKPMPIFEQKRNSITRLLNKAKIHTQWYSNQSSSGGVHGYTSIIANKANITDYSVKYKFNTNLEALRFDHDYIFPVVEKILKQQDNQVVFLHSYAGHAPYADFIPSKFSVKVDDKLEAIDDASLFGKSKRLGLKQELEQYDASIKYIDSNLATIIKQLENAEKPSIFIYFSDHGESIYTGRTHDSARYVNDMSQIPLILHFNKAARDSKPKLLAKLKQATKQPIYAPQISTLILDIFGVEYSPTFGLPKFGSEWGDAPISILVRETLNGISHIQLSGREDLNDKTLKFDQPTQAWKLSQTLKENGKTLCYDGVNSVGNMNRGLHVLNCIKLNAQMSNDRIFVTNNAAKVTDVDLGFIIDAANRKHAKIWVDIPDIDSPNGCNIFKKQLTKTALSNAQLLLEIPKISACSKQLIGIKNLQLGFYISPELAKNCSFDGQCEALEKYIKQINEQNSAAQLIVDFEFLEALSLVNNANKLVWNIKSINQHQIAEIDGAHINMISYPIRNEPNDG